MGYWPSDRCYALHWRNCHLRCYWKHVGNGRSRWHGRWGCDRNQCIRLEIDRALPEQYQGGLSIMTKMMTSRLQTIRTIRTFVYSVYRFYALLLTWCNRTEQSIFLSGY